MQLYTIHFQYDEHEAESEIFASYEGTTTDARKYLMATYGNPEIDGYMADAVERPHLLTVEGVYRFDTVHDSEGNPYEVTLHE